MFELRPYQVEATEFLAAANTTGAILPPHRPKKQEEESSQFANLSQAARAQQNGVSKRTQEKIDRLAFLSYCLGS
jgi:hypothetical protein